MKYTQMATFVVAAGLSCSSFAASDYHRLVWDTSPSTSATIGFTPTSGTNHIVKYGSTTDEQSWQSAAVSATHTFDGGLSSSFVKLTGLTLIVRFIIVFVIHKVAVSVCGSELRRKRHQGSLL